MRRFVVNVNGNSYEVEVEELEAGEETKIVSKAPVQKRSEPEPKATVVEEPISSGDGEVVEAPMPGNIFKINVEKGEAVKAGDVIMILEAMKMENEIPAPKDGKVADILVSKGVAVDTGDKLAIID